MRNTRPAYEGGGKKGKQWHGRTARTNVPTKSSNGQFVSHFPTNSRRGGKMSHLGRRGSRRQRRNTKIPLLAYHRIFKRMTHTSYTRIRQSTCSVYTTRSPPLEA
uniref:Uncharacterized protein n=1 Tax=Rhipicephalus appendiculatus TaxID=34631 RepID=A0A131YFL9_RHIAP